MVYDPFIPRAVSGIILKPGNVCAFSEKKQRVNVTSSMLRHSSQKNEPANIFIRLDDTLLNQIERKSSQ